MNAPTVSVMVEKKTLRMEGGGVVVDDTGECESCQ